MTDQDTSAEWIEAANCLATVAHQLSSAIHEANNLLQVIAGSAEMIQFKPGLSDDVVKRTEIISEHAHRVSSLLSSARDLAKCPPRVDGQSADLRELVQRALELRKHAQGRARIAVTAHLGDTPIVVRANARPVLQVVLNLLLNAEHALRATKNGRVTVQITREVDGAVLTIGDNGQGFDSDAVSAVGLSTDADGSPRLGLGLKAAHWMIGREQGTLDIAASPTGTLATLRLPVVR